MDFVRPSTYTLYCSSGKKVTLFNPNVHICFYLRTRGPVLHYRYVPLQRLNFLSFFIYLTFVRRLGTRLSSIPVVSSVVGVRVTPFLVRST